MGHPTLKPLKHPLALASLLLLSSTNAYAIKWEGMRPSSNVEDRRMEPTEAAEELDRSAGIFYQISQQAEKGEGMFICQEMKKYQGQFRILGAQLKKAPRAVPLLASGKAADLKADLSNIDACDGAMRAHLDVAEKAHDAARNRKRTFQNAYQEATAYTESLEQKVKEINQTVGPNCGSLTKPLERKLKDFNNAYENVENYLQANVNQAAQIKNQLEDSYMGFGCGDATTPSATAQGSEPMVIKVKPKKKAAPAPKKR